MVSFVFTPDCTCGEDPIVDNGVPVCCGCGEGGSLQMMDHTVMDHTEIAEEHYARGVKALGTRLVMQLAREVLGGDELSKLRLQVELADTRAVLRRLCDAYGDNDWDDTLYLADALDRHLGNYLDE